MPRLLHRKRRSAPSASSRMCVNMVAAGGAGANAPAALKVRGGGGALTTEVARTVAVGGGGAGAASAAGEVLAAVWDLPPLGGHDGAAAELREELCRLAAVAIEQCRREEELDSRLQQIERLESEQKALLQQKQTKKDDTLPNRNQLQEQLKVALAKIEKLTKDLNKLTELEEDFKTQINHMETMAKTREQIEKEHKLQLESIESERNRWEKREAEYVQNIEELRNHIQNANKTVEENMKIEISVLQNECNSRKEAITELESKVEKLELSNDALNETIRNLHAKIIGLEQQSEELRAHIEQLERSADQRTSEEVNELTEKVEALEVRDRQSEEVIVNLRQTVCQLEAADSANHEVNASLGARVEAAEMEVLGAAALRERLMELLDGESIPQDALQTDEDILAALTNLFNRFKMEQEHCHQRIEQLEARLNELESGKEVEANELYYQTEHMELHDNGATVMINSLQEKLAQSQVAEQEARAMLDELQAKVRYLESDERQVKDMNFQEKFRFPENPEQQMLEPYHLEQAVEHPTLFQHPDELMGQHPLELQHPFMHPHLHHNQLQFHVPYPPDFRLQFHPGKDSRHHLQPMPPMQPLQPMPTLQPLQPIPVPIAIPQPQMSKGTKKKQRQCFKCQKFGHLAKQCLGETTCVVCGVRGHTHNECNTNEARCANCHGPHRASSKTCPVRMNWCNNTGTEGETVSAILN